jgi:predicted Zn-ribbon and HTH transcriptional regulator
MKGIEFVDETFVPFSAIERFYLEEEEKSEYVPYKLMGFIPVQELEPVKTGRWLLAIRTLADRVVRIPFDTKEQAMAKKAELIDEMAKESFDLNIKKVTIEGKKKVDENMTFAPPLCEECGKFPADLPSTLCPGCDAYRDHLC